MPFNANNSSTDSPTTVTMDSTEAGEALTLLLKAQLITNLYLAEMSELEFTAEDIEK